MGNTILTPTAVTRKALAILHNELTFSKTVNRQYDNQFAKRGAKIGDSLKIRLPNEFTVRSGATLNVQDLTESSVTLQVATQRGIDINFSSVELTLDLDDFAERILEPAMARLASEIDYIGLGEYANIGNHVGAGLTTPTTAQVVLDAGAMLDSMAVPRANRHIVWNPKAQARMVDGLKALFHSSPELAKQYRKGLMGQALGFNHHMDQNVRALTCGTRIGTIVGKTTLAAQGASTFVIDGLTAGTETVTAGECFTVADCYAVNPETKQTTGNLRGFAATALCTGDGTDLDLTFSPAVYTSAATDPTDQNVDSFPTAEKALVFAGVAAPATTASASIINNLAYHRDAFCLATADLEMPKGVDFAAREVYDGISIRIVRQYDINNDTFPCRLDVLFGWKTLRADLACRILG